MRVYTAKYDAAYNTEDNSLVANLLKYPEIAKKVIELYPRYTTTYLLEKLGFGAGEKVLGDNSFEWKAMGRYRQAQYVADTVSNSTAKVAGAEMNLNIKDGDGTHTCMINPNDIIRFADGTQAKVNTVGANVSSTHKVAGITFITGSTTSDFDAGSVIGVVGNAFGEGSDGADVGEGYSYPETRKNWVTISRKKLVIDARDLTDITWVEHNGHRLWFFTKEQQTEAQFMYDLEVMRWFGKASIADYTATTAGSNPSTIDTTNLPVIGDGILAQIDGANVFNYAAGADITEAKITEFIGQLSLNAQSPTGNEYVVFTGTQGRIQFHKAMKDLLVADGAGGAAVLADKAGQDVALGSNFTTFYTLGNKLTLVHCPVFDDPNLAANPAVAGGTTIAGTGFNTAKLSGMMVFLDMTTQGGVANIELVAKGAEGTNRNWVKKYVPGMINPYDGKSMLAASGNDKFECHWLTQSGIIVRNPLSCGIFKPVGVNI